MSKVEIESFLKSFLLFFTSLGILISTLFYLNYLKDIKVIDEQIFSQMRVCSFDLKCKEFKIDFVPIHKQELYRLYKSKKGLDSYFPILEAQNYYLNFHFAQKKYLKNLSVIQSKTIRLYFATLFVIFILSMLFSLYALYPLRSALLLTQEFIKDILHDFNTPLSSLQINSYMLKREVGENEKITRIEQSIQNILALQENLKAYLFNYEQTKESLELSSFLTHRVELIEKNFPDITFSLDVEKTTLEINKSALSRICDNIISNAAKYNKKNGTIKISYNKKKKELAIQDSGKGIKNPSKIFNRFYKEQERGIGIGLHIVKKLCDELKIGIDVKSEVGVGTTFTLLLTHY